MFPARLSAMENPSQDRGRSDAPNDSTTTTLGDLIVRPDGPAHPPESEWVALVIATAARDQLAFRTLYERTHRLVFTLMVRLTNNRETAEELTLDVFQGVWERAPEYRVAEAGSVVAWIMNQARSRAIDRLRFDNRKKRTAHRKKRTAHHKKRTAQSWDTGVGDEDAPGADAALESQQRASRLQDALAILTGAERTAIEMAYFSEVSYARVAELLNEPTGTIKTRIRSGLTKLRGELLGEK
jgi:RNA polymerase sigma-70 factor (ECF subfamily)